MNKHFKDLPSFHVSSATKRGSQFNKPNSFIQTPIERKEQAPKVYKYGTPGSAIRNSEKEQGFDEIQSHCDSNIPSRNLSKSQFPHGGEHHL